MLYDVMYTGYHDFPVKVLSKGGETLINTDGTRQRQYDTLISINVIEHVQDAFQYLTGIICSCMRACIHKLLNTFIHILIHTYLFLYIHMLIHIHVHT